MATDGLSLYATVCELQSLSGARIDKVQQPDRDMILLHLHGPLCGRVKLMLNIHNENGRIQLTDQAFENPDVAPAFCMLLRKHLLGSRIRELSQVGMDRIAVFSLSGRDELRDEVHLKLIVELMGKHGNLFLVNADGTIMDCLRRFGIGESAARVCLPGFAYVEPPKQERLHPFCVSEEQLTALAAGRPPRLWLTDALFGISKLCSKQICSDDTPPDQIGAACFSVLKDLREMRFSPSVVVGSGVLPFSPKNAAFLSFNTMCEAQSAFYRMRDEQAVLTKRRTALRTVAEHAFRRVEKKLDACLLQISDEAATERDKRFGEMLLSYRGETKGVSSVAVTDYYENPPQTVSIPIDPKFSVQENARRYFKRYRKAKAARAYAVTQQDALAAERDYLEGILLSVEQCSSAEELSELREELILEGYLKAAPAKRIGASNTKSEPLRYRAPDGTVIRVGKNNRQNELLLRTEPMNYYWLHAKDIPASHVYIESESPSKETLRLAAEIAAYHSKASASAQVPVDYTLRRHVKKPSGARPGFVNYFHQHTVYVTPNAEAIRSHRIDG